MAKYLDSIYNQSLTLLTDLYQVTMAYSYWKSGLSERESVFNLYFRSHPFKGGFTVSCGLETALDFLEGFRFADEDLDYLATLNGNDGKPMFEEAFLKYLGDMEFSCDVYAMPEGSLVFPFEPILFVKGPILQAQLIETPLLNIINYQTLIATKSARINVAAKGEPVLEFGLRRAQGIDGAVTASRAAYIGGCSATSNVLAGKIFDIPVAGTHAHSWVMTFEKEIDAFEAYAKAMPNNCLLLVDTYDVKKGIENAIHVGKYLRDQGKKLNGIRLDSGDLAEQSQMARKMLDDAGFQDASIVASNDLDEYLLESLHEQESAIDTWGIGTKLVTAFDQPALGGVYKLASVEGDHGNMIDKIKLSEQTVKINIPGMQQVMRVREGEKYLADVIFEYNKPLGGVVNSIDPQDPTKRKMINLEHYDSALLLHEVMLQGKRIRPVTRLKDIRQRVENELSRLPRKVKRFTNPHLYFVGLEKKLYETREELILKHRNAD